MTEHGSWQKQNQISDCTGGHKVMQFDTAIQNNRDKELKD